MSGHPVAVMTVTELRRTGAGLEDTGTVFRWTGVEHSSAQDMIDLHLQAKTVRREMPGSNKVVEQALAATWQPFDISGEWDDKWGNKRFVRSDGPFALYTFQEFAQLVTRTPLVRFELDGLSFTGIITDLKIRYRIKTRIGWTITLSPHDNENVSIKPTVQISTQTLPKWIEDSVKTAQQLNTQFDTVKFIPMKTPRIDAFTATLLEVNDAIDRLQRIGADLFQSDTLNQLLLLATTFRRLRGAGLQVTLALGRLTSDVDLAFADALNSARQEEWIASSMTVGWQTIGVATRAELDATRRAKQKPRAIYYPKSGESLERISLKFYGTADNWRAIYDRNNLSSLVLNGTEELLIPERAT
jgi:hypothetical protein